MITFRLVNNMADWRGLRDAWNELWQRSARPIPEHRHEQLEIYREQFLGEKPLQVATLWQGSELIAGLPFYLTKRFWAGAMAMGLGNPYQPTSCWLLDPLRHPVSDSLKLTLEHLQTAGVNCLQLDWMRDDQAVGQFLAASGDDDPSRMFKKQRFEIAQITLEPPSQLPNLISANHRKKLKRWRTTLEQTGTLSSEVITATNSDRLPAALREALEVETDSWKGTEGTAILQDSVARSFWQQWAEQLWRDGEFHLFLLRLDGRAIAFDLGHLQRGVYTSIKIGQRDEFSGIGVGHLRDWELFSHLAATQAAHTVDLWGPKGEVKWEHHSVNCWGVKLSTGTWRGNQHIDSTYVWSHVKSLVKPS